LQRDFRLFEGLLLLFHGHTWDQTCESPFLQDNVAATRDVHVRLQNVACEQEVEHMQLATEAARQVSLADQSCVCDKLDFAVLQTAAKTPVYRRANLINGALSRDVDTCHYIYARHATDTTTRLQSPLLRTINLFPPRQNTVILSQC